MTEKQEKLSKEVLFEKEGHWTYYATLDWCYVTVFMFETAVLGRFINSEN